MQNSNTVVKELVTHVGLTFKLPKRPDGSAIWAPGVDSTFAHTAVDKFLNERGEEKIREEFIGYITKMKEMKELCQEKIGQLIPKSDKTLEKD